MFCKKLLCYALCIFTLLFLCLGCTKTPKFTKLTAVWKFEPSYTVRPGKILVVGKLINDSNRVLFEDYVVNELKIKNLNAFANYKLVPSGKKADKDQVRLAARVTGAKSVLVAKIQSVDQKEINVKRDNPDDFEETLMNDTVMMGSYLEEPTVKTILNAQIETILFDVESKKIVWAAKSKILNPDSIDAAIKDYSLAILNQLSRDKIIP